MLIAERRRRMLDQVRGRGYASFRELAGALGASESTVRRDLRSMVAAGLVVFTRGGVGTPETARGDLGVGVAGGSRPSQVDGLVGSATDAVAAERESIAAYAAAMVEPGSAVLLGPGRTTAALARHLADVRDLTVVTNSVPVIDALLGLPQIEVVVVGGTLRRSIQAFVGPITEQGLQGLRGSQVFLSGDGVSVERGLTTPNVFAAATDQALVAAGRQVVVLADHTKVGRETMCQTVPTERIDILVTDARTAPEELRRLAASRVDVRTVDVRTVDAGARDNRL